MYERRDTGLARVMPNQQSEQVIQAVRRYDLYRLIAFQINPHAGGEFGPRTEPIFQRGERGDRLP